MITGPDWTKGLFFENAIKHKQLIQYTAHLVSILPMTLEQTTTVSDGPFMRETRNNPPPSDNPKFLSNVFYN